MRIQRDQIYVAIESFAGDGVAVAKGLRLRGDNPLVARCPWAFLEDGASEEAAVSKRQENNRAAEARSSALAQSLPVAAQPRPIQDENKMICIRQAGAIGGPKSISADGEPMGALVGQIVSRNARIYRENRSHFLAAVPAGLRPEDALVAQTDLTFHDGNGAVRKIWAGQWVNRADPAVQIQWPHFAPVPREAVRTS